MARANLKNMEKAIAAAAGEIVNRLTKERELDSSHIEAHVEESRKAMAALMVEEEKLLAFIEEHRKASNASCDSMVAGIKSLFDEMRETENTRLKSLQAHADDINNDAEEPPVLQKKGLRAITG